MRSVVSVEEYTEIMTTTVLKDDSDELVEILEGLTSHIPVKAITWKDSGRQTYTPGSFQRGDFYWWGPSIAFQLVRIETDV